MTGQQKHEPWERRTSKKPLTEQRIRRVELGEVRLLLVRPVGPGPHLGQAGAGRNDRLHGPDEQIQRDERIVLTLLVSHPSSVS